MKKIIISLIVFSLHFGIKAQCDIAQKLLAINPATIAIGETATIDFAVGNEGTDLNCAYPVGSIEIVLSLPLIGYEFVEILTPASKHGTYFNWTYDNVEKVIVGINHSALAAGVQENVSLKVIGISTSKAQTNLNISVLDGSSNKSIINDPGLVSLNVGISAPLPVRLLSFEGKSTNFGNKLGWLVNSEQNFSHYELQKSLNGTEFQHLAKIDGSKSSKENLFYEYLDSQTSGSLPGAIPTPHMSNSYYRLKMVDLDGTYSWSKIIYINTENIGNYVGEFYPNPVTNNQVKLEVNTTKKDTWAIMSYDLRGKIISTEKIILNSGKNIISLDVSKYSGGVNLFRIENEDTIYVRKVIKE